jgi:hypothetical protein
VVQDAVVLLASTAVHVIVVEPTGNSEPDAGEHVVVAGGVPPTTAVLTWTLTGFPFDELAVGALHVTASGVAVVDV